jgi:hypothetical protein
MTEKKLKKTNTAYAVGKTIVIGDGRSVRIRIWKGGAYSQPQTDRGLIVEYTYQPWDPAVKENRFPENVLI